MKAKITLLPLITLLISGCSSMNVEDFQNTQPEFVLEEYFEGRTMAWGLFEDRFGKVQRQFVVTMDGTWDGTTLILNEDFVYNDGETENRVWTLTKTDDMNYEGTTQNSIMCMRLVQPCTIL